jgi:molecular chaperone DnaK (HSP70)
MSAENDPAQRVAIGISFGNSYSSIAFTTGVSGSCKRLILSCLLT